MPWGARLAATNLEWRDDDGIDAPVFKERSQTGRIVLGRGGRQHIHGVSNARGARESRREVLLRNSAQLCDVQPLGLERVGSDHARSAGVRKDGDARSRRRRAVFQCPRPIKHLLGREGAEDAALGEGRVESRV